MRAGGQIGQAAVELVVVAAIMIAVTLALGQFAIAGYALWSAADAARAGARARQVGGDAERAALSVLPGWLEHGATVSAAGPVEVRVRAPAVLPGVPSVRLGAAASLAPDGGR